MAKYVIVTDGPVFDYKPEISNGGIECHVREKWEDVMLFVGPLVENGRNFKIDCFNGEVDSPEPPTIEEYRQFMVNIDEYGMEDYLY